ncbi:hypothetical protein AM593_00972, partial [Mytilus galloprovincialis]
MSKEITESTVEDLDKDQDERIAATKCVIIDQFLSIAKIYGVTDFSLNVLAKTAISLQHLNVQGCWRITNSSIIVLGEYAKCLEALQVRDCRDITEASLARLRTRGIKIDVRPPPEARNLNILHNALGLRQRLNVQI